ncbi:RecX family transcriptional regulator [Psychrobium sp. 1_MG-2023]|uniref:RecX family transcriptional regulator n=1 Tax=Psychrobium sp. 1_MG-2023 TaxID=3062624 RepID=UPI000C342AD4|nr:RecX family transcriptional regulator [Psychrobium sp. 1_MG-2023]MDP2562566.1 RecX family transcriptional regulator [Psychrobium sp. 1_MG-2023]PKF56784.1 RecX family transcriptional regulator [Alteromonadales bacterium alter-6D02]
MQRPPLRQAKTIDNVFNSAYWHLNQQDFTIAEIRSKLERKTQNSEWIKQVLNHLIEHKYLKSDLEFAIRYCESAFSNNIGKSAVQHKLKQRGISSTNIDTAIEQVIEQQAINFDDMASNRLLSRYITFDGISREKVYSQMTTKGFTRPQIDQALSQHPAQDTLRSKLAIKAEKADLASEITKLYRKGKGQSLILNELKQRLIDVSAFEDTLYQLTLAGDIDFYHSCKQQLAKKRYDLADYKEKSKAYAYLSRKGFSSDEIKEAMASEHD